MPTPATALSVDARHVDTDTQASQQLARPAAALGRPARWPGTTPAATPTTNGGHRRARALPPETVASSGHDPVSLRERCLTEAAQFLVDQLAALDAMTEDEAIHAFGCADADAARAYRRRLRSARRDARR
jgi:hypothetical protein